MGELGAPRPRKSLWSGLAGPRDADGETAIGVEVDADRVLEFQTAAHRHALRRRPAAPVPPRLRLRRGPFPPGDVAAAGARDREAGRPARRSGDADGPAARRLPLDRRVEHARLGQRRARAGRARRAERRGRRRPPGPRGMGGDGRGEFVTARSTAGGYAVRGLRMFPGDGASLDAFRAQEPPAPLPDRVRAGARAALRRRDPRRSGRRRGALARSVLGAAAEADAGVVRDGRSSPRSRWARRRRRPRASAPPRSASWRCSPSSTARRAPSGWSPTWRPRPTARRACRCWWGSARRRCCPTAQAVLGAKGYAPRMPGRGADDAGAGAQEPRRARGAGRRGRRARPTRRSGWSTAALSRAAVAAGVAAGGAAGVDKAAVDDRARAARVLGVLRRRRARRRCWWAPSGADRRRCARRSSSAIGKRARSCAARRCWRRSRAGRRRRRRARPICCAPLPAAVEARPGRPRRGARPRCARRWRPSAASRCAGARSWRWATLGERRRSGALARCARRGDEPVLRYLATRELAGLTPARRDGAPALRAALDRRGSARARDRGARRSGKQGDTGSGPALIARRQAGAVAVRPPRRGGGAGPSVRAGRRRPDAPRHRQGRRRGAPGRAGRPGRAARTRARGTVLLKKLGRSRRRAATVRELAGGADRRIGRHGRGAAAGDRAARAGQRGGGRPGAGGRRGDRAARAGAPGRPGRRRRGGDAGGRQAPPLPVDAPSRRWARCAIRSRAAPTLRAIATAASRALAAAAQNAEKHCGWQVTADAPPPVRAGALERRGSQDAGHVRRPAEATGIHGRARTWAWSAERPASGRGT